MIKKATLIKENEKLKREIFIWKNIGIGMNASTKEKEIATKEFLEDNVDFNFYEVCKTIGLSKATYYNFLYNKAEKTLYEINDEKLYIEIKKVYDSVNGIYGADKIKVVLQKNGITTSSRKVTELMRRHNLVKRNVMKRPKQTVNKERRKYFRNLLKREFNPDEPNKIWVSDFLEIKVKGVKFYLCVVLDLFARKVVAWRLSHNINTNLAINTFKDAFESRNEPVGLIFHSDQGCEFTSQEFQHMLKMLAVKQSFSYPGSPNDNACMEGFYSVLRREEININIDKYENSRVIKEYLTNYFNIYNNVRIHRTLNDMTPNEVEEKWYIEHKTCSNFLF